MAVINIISLRFRPAKIAVLLLSSLLVVHVVFVFATALSAYAEEKKVLLAEPRSFDLYREDNREIPWPAVDNREQCCSDLLSGLYHLIGPIRLWMIVISAFYATIYGAFLYAVGMRRAHDLHALGLSKSVQRSVNEEFSDRFWKKEPLMMIYSFAIILFFGSIVSFFVEQWYR